MKNFNDEKYQIFYKLQNAFVSSISLVHFDSNRRLYVDLDVSKRWNFVVMIYHIIENSNDKIIYSRFAMQSILFLNKLLNDAKQNYWFIELKIIDIVWIIKRIRHMIDFIRKSFIIIYIDHSIVVSIFKQIILITFNIDKLNLRLVRASQYLFNFNIIIRHKFDKFNVIFDALSRLSNKTTTNVTNKIEILDVLYKHFVKLTNEKFRTTIIQNLSIVIYHVILMKIFDDFKNRLKIVYITNDYWRKILKIIKNDFESIDDNVVVINEQSRDIRFKLRNDLIYYTFDENKKRLCVSTILEQKILRLTHDFNNHNDFYRIYDKITNSMYIRQLIKRLHDYIDHCSKCQLNQTKRHSFYEFLQSIFISSISFHIINIDFILILSIIISKKTNSKKLNNAMIITCKFTKKIMILFDKFIWLTMKWINSLIIALMFRDWNILKFIVNNKNFKFMSSFWRVIFQKFKINLLTSIIYHSQTNDQFEKTNQILEITLRFWLLNLDNID